MSRKFKADVVRSISFSSITDSYVNLGTALTVPINIMIIKNTTDVTILVSENGSDDHYELLAGTLEAYDFQANARSDEVGQKSAGTQFTVKGLAGDLPTSGKIILQGQYS